MADQKLLYLRNSAGLCFNFLENGSVKTIEADPVRISLQSSTPFSRSGTNIYLRKRTNPFGYTPLLGPESESRFTITKNAFIAAGAWAGINYVCVLELSATGHSWRWRIELENATGDPAEIDLFYVQDIGLKAKTDGLINACYVSQYIERRILEDTKFGSVICCRQNMKESAGHPWLMMSCKNGAVAASVDGIQFYGKTCRETGIPEGLMAERLGGEYAGESPIIALQEKPVNLAAGGHHQGVFFATYLPDHPEATSLQDLGLLKNLDGQFAAKFDSTNVDKLTSPDKNIFNTAEFFPADDLSEQELDRFFDKNRRHCEEANGELLSFFCSKNNHVVLRAKELIVDRPHAHIMQARAGFVPDESIVSTTAFAFGVFNSHLTQGNTNFNTLLSVCTSQFNLSPETGQRIFVLINGRRYLLGVPSAFEIGLNHCRWIYKQGGNCFQVRTWTSKTLPRVNLDFKVISGPDVSLLITHHFDSLNGWTIDPGNNGGTYLAKPEAGSMIAGKFPQAKFRIVVHGSNTGFEARGDAALYDNRQSHGEILFVLDVKETSRFCMSITGEVCTSVESAEIENADLQFQTDCHDAWSDWQKLCLNLSLTGGRDDIAAIREILPWYGMNAITHFLTPYGLEQFSGAAWGTRDISQGPFDLLLTMEKYDEAKQLLRIIFSNQNQDGGWPQWWMFDSYTDIRADSAHGDVFYWCMIALGNYIRVTGDLAILDEILPYYHAPGEVPAEKAPLTGHIDRLIEMIVRSFIPGTALVPFGGGDWNDSLQPVSRELAQRMISSWTVEMNYQAFSEFQMVYERTGNKRRAAELKDICDRIKADFNKYLVRDGVVAGYGLVEEDRSISLLLHPVDQKTNIQYSILPMNRGIISGIFTKEQALHHQDLIEQHLKGPDGARLMNRPLRYNGGIQTLFQRAESSTFFGREIGLMYVHEHIRYAEAQALTGKADAFLRALRQAIPVAYQDVVPCGDTRQSNCYYSSSDVAFKSRYDADARYDEIKTGKITLKGGWRVYSSGPGIYIGLIVTRFLGLRIESENIIIDPVMPHSQDGIFASMDFMGYPVKFNYHVLQGCCGPRSIYINGTPTVFTEEANRYRQGGAVMPKEQFLAMLNRQENIVEVFL